MTTSALSAAMGRDTRYPPRADRRPGADDGTDSGVPVGMTLMPVKPALASSSRQRPWGLTPPHIGGSGGDGSSGIGGGCGSPNAASAADMPP